MKLISLNIWGGIVFEPLMEFVKNYAADTDFFCFQEVFDTPYTILNFHGLWHPTIKKIDCPERIEQSKKIRAFMDTLPGEKILCGDFNLMPDTESLALLGHGMRNLVKEYGVATTRSELYKKEQRFADYTLITPGVDVTNFNVPHITVSDHLPMVLEFS